MRYDVHMKYTVNSIEDTKEVAEKWFATISQEFMNDSAKFVGLSGHLGAGKTAFVKLLGEILGVEETITSPTFVIMKIYKTKKGPWSHLVHIDAYRLEKAQELEALNFEAVLSDKNNLVIMEWPENVGIKDFDKDAHISFEIVGDKREMEIV
jgi:tRNA threonylcarbamoyladenosine biosynthesis protein TsaE